VIGIVYYNRVLQTLNLSSYYQFRDGYALCYSWACDSFSADLGRLGTTLHGLWEVACSFSRAIDVHTKVIGLPIQ